MASIKFLSVNSNIPFILVLESIDYLFQFGIFLVLGMPNDFLLKPAYFGCYIIRLWVLFEPFVLADFIDGASADCGGRHKSKFANCLC